MFDNNNLKHVIKSQSFLNYEKNKMIMPLGINSNGKIIFNDIQSMSQVFIGGSTGSGKSTFLHSLILSLITRYTYQELKLVLADFKMVEFSCYDEISHLMMPIINDFETLEQNLKLLLEEKQRRLDILNTYNVLNIKDYNEYALNNNVEKMPSIMVIIDELDEFTVVDDFENLGKNKKLELLKTLIKDAENVGIHLIIATQIPSCNFTDEELKKEFVTRICFKTNSSVDSECMINSQEAINLNGHGDMIYLNNTNDEQHFQGLYANHQDITELLDKTDIFENDTIEEIQLLESDTETLESEEDLILKEAEKKKKLKKNYLKILIQLIVSSLVYLIASSCDKFEGINTSADVKNMIVLEYAKYIMYGTYVLTLIAIIIFVIKIGKKEFPKIKINLEKLYSVIDWIILFPLCISIATFCFTFLFTFTNVSGDSMNPNIHESDRLLVTYPSEYNRFDVVVVKVDSSYLNVRDNDLYLKRIIGLPGEYIDYRFENGITQLYVNGKKVSEDFYTEAELRKYLTYNTSYSHELFDWGEKCFTEGTDAPVKQCDKIEGHYIIPEGYYFVLGDNRLVSKDSRDIGLIKEEDIIGVTKYILNDIFKPIKID